MVCWRDRAARGFDTLFCRNQGNEIFRRLFCDFVGNNPGGGCILPLPLLLPPLPPPPLLLLLLLLLIMILFLFSNRLLFTLHHHRHHRRLKILHQILLTALIVRSKLIYVHFNGPINNMMNFYLISTQYYTLLLSNWHTQAINLLIVFGLLVKWRHARRIFFLSFLLSFSLSLAFILSIFVFVAIGRYSFLVYIHWNERHRSDGMVEHRHSFAPYLLIIFLFGLSVHIDFVCEHVAGERWYFIFHRKFH